MLIVLRTVLFFLSKLKLFFLLFNEILLVEPRRHGERDAILSKDVQPDSKPNPEPFKRQYNVFYKTKIAVGTPKL